MPIITAVRPGETPMPVRMNDEIIQRARQAQQEKIEECSRLAARKILAHLSKDSKPSADMLTKLIAAEFDELSA